MLDRYKLGLMNMTINDYINNLEQCGWFSDIPITVHDEVIQRIKEQFDNDPRHTFSALRAFAFDVECIYASGPDLSGFSYYEKLAEFARHSNGQFAPTDIQDNLTDDSTQIYLTFRQDQKFYECSISNTDYFQYEVYDLINQALQDRQISQRFHVLPAVDQIAEVVFVSPRVYACAQKHGLIPPPNYFSSPSDILDEYLLNYYAEQDGSWKDYKIYITMIRTQQDDEQVWYKTESIQVPKEFVADIQKVVRTKRKHGHFIYHIPYRTLEFIESETDPTYFADEHLVHACRMQMLRCANSGVFPDIIPFESR